MLKLSMSYDLPMPLAAKALRDADSELRAQHAQGVFQHGDPNHPRFNNGINYSTGKPATLFGYDAAAFMAKQYKVQP